MSLILLILFAAPLLLEGTGYINNYTLVYYYLLLPALLFFYTTLVRKNLFFPRMATVLFSIFLILSLISSLVFSVDIQKSFKLTLFYTSSYLIFVFIYNLKKVGAIVINGSILAGSVVFITSFLLLHYLSNNFSLLHLPYDGYQLVYSYYGSHNHLGDFLGLSVIFFIFMAVTKKLRIAVMLNFLILPFLLISYSRSSFNALLWTAVYYFIVLKKRIKMSVFTKISIIVGCCFVFFFSILIVKESRSVFFLKPFNDLFVHTFGLQNKDLFAERQKYFVQALHSFYMHPFWGIGSDNFGYASKTFEQYPGLWSETSHNIILDILVENGLFSAILFIIFVILIIKSGLKLNSVYPLLFIYLLLNFQTDYTFRIYSVFMLFMILGGLIYKEQKEISSTILFGICSLGLQTILVLMLAGDIFFQAGKPQLSVQFYPLSAQAYPQAITENQKSGNVSWALNDARRYEWLGSYDISTNGFLAHFYESIQDKSNALRIYEKVYILEDFSSFTTVKKIYDLKKDLLSKNEADQFLISALGNFKKQKQSGTLIGEIDKQITDYCRNNSQDECSKAGWL